MQSAACDGEAVPCASEVWTRVPDRFGPFARVHVADSTGFELPESLKDTFPGAGGSAAQTGTKIQGVWYENTVDRP